MEIQTMGDNNNNNNNNLEARICSNDPVSWSYFMRRNKQQILPGVFLGHYAVAMRNQKQSLLDDGITHIVCVRSEAESKFIRANFPESFIYLTLDISDSIGQPILPYFETTRQFIDSCLKAGGKVLVHGNAGLSRSATLVAAYVMSWFWISAEAAFKFVSSKRGCVCPILSFMRQLKEYEPILRAEGIQSRPFIQKRAIESLYELEDYDRLEDRPQ